LILVENLPGAMLTLVQILLVLMTVARHGLRNAHGPLVAPDLLIVYNGKLCAFADWYKAANHLVGRVVQQLIEVRLGKLLTSILGDSAPGIDFGPPLRLL